jgi:hypothetical protein
VDRVKTLVTTNIFTQPPLIIIIIIISNVEENLTLEQATKAQRGSRVIALLFL